MNLPPWLRRVARWLWLLRYLWIFPIYLGYRKRSQRSLRWRLAGSHLATAFLSVLAISMIGAVFVVAAVLIDRPSDREPALEAQEVARLLATLDKESSFTPSQTSAVLQALATGELGPNAYQREIIINARVGSQFQNISSISIVDRGLVVTASSSEEFIGRTIVMAGPAAPAVAQRALDGETDTAKNTIIREGTSSITGSYPIVDEDGRVVAAVVVDKSARSLPFGWRLALLGANYIGQLGLTIAFLVCIPAIPVGTIIGIRRARAISQPVAQLAKTAEEFAQGNLEARVAVRGDDEIAALERSFNSMASRLQASMADEAASRRRAEQLLAANRDLVANVSHELRTPVALIRGHLEALESDPENAEDYSRIALRETDRLERLVEDLFQLTRIESQGLILDVDVFDVGSAVREAVDSLAEPARREAGITMATDAGECELACRGDRARLVQVLQNLIRNAIRYTPEGGIILVTARAEEGQIAIAVRDTGVGIAPDDLPRVFDRFFRADSSRARAGGGAGLGLSIAREVIEAMGGSIGAESVLGEGSVFTIRLPAVAAVDPAVNAPSAVVDVTR